MDLLVERVLAIHEAHVAATPGEQASSLKPGPPGADDSHEIACSHETYLEALSFAKPILASLIDFVKHFVWYRVGELNGGVVPTRDEMFQRAGGVATSAGMNWGSLNNGAARCDEPVK